MAQELGRIEKPELKEFHNTRKLFCLPLIPQFNEKDLKDDLKNSIEQFWKQATIQIYDLERTGKISNIYFESITRDGKPGLEMIKQVNHHSYNIIKEKVDSGAKLVLIENENILNEFLDWTICLSVIQKSQKVFNKVLEFHQESKNRRNSEIANKINETLKTNESGLLVMTDENRLQIQPSLPSDIQVFLIHPPALNDIMKWLREYLRKQGQQ